MAWVERVPGHIWTNYNFLADDICQRVLESMRASTSKNLRNTEQMSAKLRSIDVNYNGYDYVIYQYDIRKDPAIIGAIADSLDEVLAMYGQTAPRDRLNAMQCFVKSFGPESHYDLHVESQTKYGQWAFIHFLSDEDSGDLLFPDTAMIEEYLRKHPEQKSIWEANKQQLADFNEETLTVGPFRMQPRYNNCILFRTGSAHYVETMLNNTGFTRPTITGWPHASQKMLDDLNRNCNINENFGHR